MLDLETLATTPNSVIITFGAIRFDPFGDDSASYQGDTILMDSFYRRIDPASFESINHNIDDNTLAWWMKQSDEVKLEAFAEENRHSIQSVMLDFHRWAKTFDTVWANGPAFDIVILEHINRELKRTNPWKYWQVKDSRTVYGLVEHERPNPRLHHALWDCWSQIVALQNCFKNLNITHYRQKNGTR
jgi:hypothetical protein